ncbi:MAG: adenosine deaminase [Acidimicrobiales bacterium]
MLAFVDRPKVVLHDHLDGGLRPATVVELADAAGVGLPSRELGELARWFTVQPHMGVEEAFTRFDLVIAVMQTAEALRRVAREAVEDHAADGVVHAELRFAPLAHTAGGLGGDEVIDAVLVGVADAAATGTTASVIACALRTSDPAVSRRTAELAAAWAGRGVVGFDLAGPESGHPASDHAEAFAVARGAGLGCTVHAGAMHGVEAVADALDAARIGQGGRLIADCEVADGRSTAGGPTAARVREAGLVLEICLTSNACLGLPLEQHPARQLVEAGFRVTLNPDDRSITTTTTSREHDLAARVLGFTTADLAAANERAALAAFVQPADRDELVARVRRGWNVRPARLVHLAPRDRWETSVAAATPYLPPEFDRDGFIHLSALHQVLSPANAAYRGRRDLVALVVDAHLLGDAVVWEPGTGTAEWYPHLYGALLPEAVLAAVDIQPGPDDTFVLPAQLVDLVRC